jgi:hypothetical protein
MKSAQVDKVNKSKFILLDLWIVSKMMWEPHLKRVNWKENFNPCDKLDKMNNHLKTIGWSSKLWITWSLWHHFHNIQFGSYTLCFF